MDCKHFTNRLRDLALGVLDGPRRTEVEAHVERCPACRAALDRERRLAAAIDREVVTHLAAAPSPDFAARVRLRLAHEPAPETASSSWASSLAERLTEQWGPAVRPRGWTRAVAFALAAAMVLGAVWAARRRGSAGLRPALPSTASATTVAGQGPALPPPQRAASATSVAGQKPALPPLRRATRREARREIVAEVMPEVIVDPHEQENIARLYYAIQSHRVDLVSFMAVPPGFKRQADGSLAAAPLEIEPAPDAAKDAWPGEAEPEPGR